MSKVIVKVSLSKEVEILGDYSKSNLKNVVLKQVILPQDAGKYMEDLASYYDIGDKSPYGYMTVGDVAESLSNWKVDDFKVSPK